MNRGFRKCLAVFFAFVSALCLGWPGAQVAGAQARLRVLLLSPESSPFAQRVRGQTGDLALELTAHAIDVAPADIDLGALLIAQGADAALWLEARPGAAPLVRLFDGQSKVMQARPAELPEGGAADSSATNEIAALLARGELVELLDTRAAEQATSRHGPPPSSTSDANDKPEAEVSSEAKNVSPQEPASASARASGLELGLGLGFRATQVNSARWLLGLEAGAFLARRALSLAVYYAGSFQDSRTLGDTRLGLRQDRVTANLSGAFRVLSQLQIQAGVDLGLSLFDRTTQAVAGSFEATPRQRSATFVAAPRLSLLWRFASYLGLGASAGVDLLTTPPSYELESQGARRELERLRWAQPWCTLGLVGTFSSLARPSARPTP